MFCIHETAILAAKNFKMYHPGALAVISSSGLFTNIVWLIPAWISYHMLRKVWDEITYPFLNFNGATVEV